MGCAGPYRGTISLSAESSNPPAPPTRGKRASEKKEKGETVKINEQRPLRDTPTRQEMTRSTKMVSTYLYQKSGPLSPIAFLLQHPFRDMYVHFYLQAVAFFFIKIENNYITDIDPVCQRFPLKIPGTGNS